MSICSQLLDRVEQRLSEVLTLRNDRIAKEDGSYVTKGDLLVQEILKKAIEDIRPQTTIISEEQSWAFKPSYAEDFCLIIDPIDGTENFTSGLKEWGVSLCLFNKGRHLESMLALPELGERLVTGQKIVRSESRIYGLSSSLDPSYLQQLPSGREYRIMGCCVYNMYNVIKGSYVAFENPKGARVWDIMAGLNLALEHGLSVFVNGEKYDGRFLSPTEKYRFKISN